MLVIRFFERADLTRKRKIKIDKKAGISFKVRHQS